MFPTAISCQHSDLNHPLVDHEIKPLQWKLLRYFSLSFVTMIRKELKNCLCCDLPDFGHV